MVRGFLGALTALRLVAPPQRWLVHPLAQHAFALAQAHHAAAATAAAAAAGLSGADAPPPALGATPVCTARPHTLPVAEQATAVLHIALGDTLSQNHLEKDGQAVAGGNELGESKRWLGKDGHGVMKAP